MNDNERAWPKIEEAVKNLVDYRVQAALAPAAAYAQVQKALEDAYQRLYLRVLELEARVKLSEETNER